MIASKPIPHGQIETYTTADIADSVNKRYQTDNQQTYNDATSSIQTQLNAKLASTSWVDYSATSTIVGFSAFSEKDIRYLIIGDLCTIYINIVGTSNSTFFTFTLPFNNTGGTQWIPLKIRNGGTFPAALGYADLPSSSSTVTLYATVAAGNWTASGAKGVYYSFSFKIN